MTDHSAVVPDRPRRTFSLAGATISSSVGQILAVLFAVVASVTQARLLGPAARGELALWQGAGAITTLFLGLGLGSAITYFVARGFSLASLVRPLTGAFVITLLVALLSFAAVSGSSATGILPGSISATFTILTLTAYFALSQFGAWMNAILAGRGEFRWVTVSSAAAGFTAVVGSVVLLLRQPLQGRTEAVIMVVVGAEAIRTGALGWAIARNRATRERTHETRFGAVGLGALASFAALNFFADAIQFLTYRVDIWFVNAWHGPEELGRYAVAVSLAQLVWVVPTAAARAVFPYTAMIGAQEVYRTVLFAARWAVLGSFVLGLILAVGAYAGVNLVFGPGFEGVPTLVSVLLVGIVPYASAKLMGSYVAGAGALRPNLIAAAGTLFLTVALDLGLIPPLGALGAAVASAISYVVYTAWVHRIARNVSTTRNTPLAGPAVVTQI